MTHLLFKGQATVLDIKFQVDRAGLIWKYVNYVLFFDVQGLSKPKKPF